MAVSAFDIKAFGALDAAQLKYMAQQAEVVERYDDMCRFMHQFVSQTVPTGDSHKQAVKGGNPNLTVDERNLLSIAYKNVIGARRASWRTLQPEEKEASNKELAALTAQYRAKVENELEAICKEVLELLQTRLLNVDVTLTKDGDPILPDVEKDWESKVFYLKMTADYYRYLAEFKDSEETPVDQRYGPKARDFYQEALNIASKKLKSTHPIRLGLALNYSVCHYEILHNPDEACLLAKTSFEQAIKELDVLSEKEYKDSTLIMQLLRDNLTLWTSEKQQQNESG